MFALPLRPVSMDGRGGESGLSQPVLELVCGPLGLDEDEREACDIGEKVEHNVELVALFHKLDFLCDEVRGGAHAADGDEDVVGEEVACEALDGGREGGREHERLAVAAHVLLLDDAPDLRLESHVEHAIRLVEGEHKNTREPDAPALQEVHEATRGGHNQVRAALELAQLVTDVRTAVHDDGREASTVKELSALCVDLRRELACGRQDEAPRQGAGVAAARRGRRRVGIAQHLGDDRDEEGGRLPGPSLRARHEVTAGNGDGDGRFLDGRRARVARQLDVLQDHLGHAKLGELVHCGRAVLARGLHGDVVVLVKVDSRLALALRLLRGFTKDLKLQALVALLRARRAAAVALVPAAGAGGWSSVVVATAVVPSAPSSKAHAATVSPASAGVAVAAQVLHEGLEARAAAGGLGGRRCRRRGAASIRCLGPEMGWYVCHDCFACV
mmetsp:Transcript_5820/g.14314  ORF Transcript_5820/g.14314 Transcript_5820/m.14314 type:complete len:444 (-) Transcript_5820:47-1378(-)